MSLQTGELAVGRLPQDGTPRTAIRAHELRKVYGQGDTAVAALDGVSVDFGVGQFTAIMGPSGSGKSTLMHCLAGLDTPTDGQVLLGCVECDGHEAVRGKAHAQCDAMVDVDGGDPRQGLPPDRQHRVRGDDRVADRLRLRGVELLGLVAVGGVGQVEVARHAQELGRGHGRAGAPPAVGHVRLDRPEILPSVEDDRQRLGHREAPDPQRHGGGCIRIDERALQQVVCFVHDPSYDILHYPIRLIVADRGYGVSGTDRRKSSEATST